MFQEIHFNPPPPRFSHCHLFLFNSSSVEQLQAFYLTSQTQALIFCFIYGLKIFANTNWAVLCQIKRIYEFIKCQ